jgi:hypothetical protein
MKQKSINSMTGNQLEISNTIRRLWMEHVLWTRFFIISNVFDLPDLQVVTQRLLQNPDDFAKVLQGFYGTNAAIKFRQLFTEHLLIAADLVGAAKDGDTRQVDEQRRVWYKNAAEIASFLASANPFWSERTWKDLLFEHLRMTENEAVYTLSAQYEKSIKEYDSIQAEALEMADDMAIGIIHQFPKLFIS